MYYHHLSQDQNNMISRLRHTRFGDMAAIVVSEFGEGYKIVFRFDKTYSGVIYPMHVVANMTKFRERFRVKEFVEYMWIGSDRVANPDICSACLERFYEGYDTVYVVTINCDLDDLFKCPSVAMISFFFLVFCPHSDVVEYIEEQYYMDDYM